ncbi:hypothetical protein BFP72_11960 [Reichenbachiella sp. 5M10]|uniref:sensor histidine kinase n=1 Tax=Reichenbachiella sp. 5M10 TaxID=1889772 RepID=UPI000C148F82|nr:HAMP domain-containing sensor histidine kinase [Reichenbachiella sp. 5M10]PIB36057.1 hypothetical protein BFP72_11960 [Reichenbachiella sp. 5M10]
MNVYQTINQLGFKRSYVQKFLLVAFIGTHIPLIAAVIYILKTPQDEINPTLVLLVILSFTVVALVITAILLTKLLAPIKLAAQAMEEFKAKESFSPLPQNYEDEAGQLLVNISQTLTQVKALADERQNYTSMITHDLRSPVSAIVSMAEVIQSTDDIHEAHEYTALILQSGDHALQIIEDTLHIIRSSNFTIDPGHKSTTPAEAFVLQQLDLLRGANSSKKIKFNVQIDKSDLILIHPELFAHVLRNLLTNAIKFSTDNGIVDITGHHDRDRFVISIRDYGMGFIPSKAETIFDKFTQEKKKGTHNEPTTGLGLYLSRTLTEKHHGTLTAQSDGPNQGATFTISLPTS